MVWVKWEVGSRSVEAIGSNDVSSSIDGVWTIAIVKRALKRSFVRHLVTVISSVGNQPHILSELLSRRTNFLFQISHVWSLQIVSKGYWLLILVTKFIFLSHLLCHSINNFILCLLLFYIKRLISVCLPKSSEFLMLTRIVIWEMVTL